MLVFTDLYCLHPMGEQQVDCLTQKHETQNCKKRKYNINYMWLRENLIATNKKLKWFWNGHEWVCCALETFIAYCKWSEVFLKGEKVRQNKFRCFNVWSKFWIRKYNKTTYFGQSYNFIITNAMTHVVHFSESK